MDIRHPFSRLSEKDFTDDGLPDISSPADTFAPPDEPRKVDWLMHDLQEAVNKLSQENLTGYTNELDIVIVKLGKLLEKARKPF